MKLFGKVFVEENEVVELRVYREDEKRRYNASKVKAVRDELEAVIAAKDARIDGLERTASELEGKVEDLNDQLESVVYDTTKLAEREQAVAVKEAKLAAKENNIDDRITAAAAEARAETLGQAMKNHTEITKDILQHGQNIGLPAPSISYNGTPPNGTMGGMYR